MVINEQDEEKFCMQNGNRFTCNDGSCYTISEKCDGIFNCLDGADELDCLYLMNDKIRVEYENDCVFFR